MGARGLLLVLAALLAGCAGSSSGPGPGPTPRADQIGKVSPDKAIARMLASGQTATARKSADSLMALRDPGDREVGAYWKAVCLLYDNQLDSALVIFQAHEGKWRGGLRLVHSEAFLRLVKELSQAQAAFKTHKEESASQKSLQDRIEGLQKETGDLRSEITRLETEKQKYEKLLKDLETIR